MDELKERYAPCPTCKQYSHSIGEGAITTAFNHFQTMYSHRGDGMPTQCLFDDKTQDAAQVLTQALTALQSDNERLRKAAQKVLEWWPEGSETRSRAGKEKGDGFADDISALRASVKGDKSWQE